MNSGHIDHNDVNDRFAPAITLAVNEMRFFHKIEEQGKLPMKSRYFLTRPCSFYTSGSKIFSDHFSTIS